MKQFDLKPLMIPAEVLESIGCVKHANGEGKFEESKQFSKLQQRHRHDADSEAAFFNELRQRVVRDKPNC